MKRIIIINFLIFFITSSLHATNLFADNNDTFKNIFISEKISLEGCQLIEVRSDGNIFSIVKKNGKCGLLKSQNQLVLPIEFDTIVPCYWESCFFISKNSLFGVVNTDGFLTVPIYYEYIEVEAKGEQLLQGVITKKTFIVQKNRKLGTIDFRNNLIIPIEYDGISNWVEHGPKAHYVKKNGLYGLINYNTGELIIPILYEGIKVRKNLVEVKRNGLFGVRTLKNEEVIPCVYDKIFVDLNYFGLERNHKERIFAKSNQDWSEFLVDGKLVQSKLVMGKNYKFLKNVKANSYKYHLQDCMVFPK